MNSIFFDTTDTPRAICAALQHALEVVMPEIMAEQGFETRNGIGLFRWNSIIHELQKRIPTVGRCHRNGWVLPVLYHKDKKYVITFMSKDRLKNLQRHGKNSKHYLQAAVLWNGSLAPQSEQLSLDVFNTNDEDPNFLKAQEQLAESVWVAPEKIEGHILVVFECAYDKLLGVTAVRLTKNLAPSAEQENWSEFIGAPYEEANTILSVPASFEQDDDLLVELR